MERICNACKISKPMAEFYKQRVNEKTGKQYYQYTCKPCMSKKAQVYRKSPKGRAYQRGVRVKNKQLVRDIKGDGECYFCAEKDVVTLDFHHLRDKRLDIADAVRGTAKGLMHEIQKCVLLCSNCHRKLHAYGWKVPDTASLRDTLAMKFFDCV